MSYKLAGVTFESRQQILEKIYNSKGPLIKCFLNRTTYDGSPAIQVIEENSALQVGWIAKVDIPKLYSKNCQVIHGRISHYMDKWFCELYNPIFDNRSGPFRKSQQSF